MRLIGMKIIGLKQACLGALAAGVWSVAIASAVSASCAAPPVGVDQALQQAPVIFVGRVVATSNGDREAIINVVSQWRGRPLPAQVTVVGTPDQAAAATSVDRRYTTGLVYLVVPVNTSSPFSDNACTMTREYTPDLVQYAPAGARAYPSPGPAAPGIAMPVLLAGALIVVLGAVIMALVVRGRRQRGQAIITSGASASSKSAR